MAATTSYDAAALKQAIEAVGIDTRGIDMARLVRIKSETEERIAAHRDEFVKDAPSFDPPAPEDGARGVA
jgi:hypothetical protein